MLVANNFGLFRDNNTLDVLRLHFFGKLIPFLFDARTVCINDVFVWDDAFATLISMEKKT